MLLGSGAGLPRAGRKVGAEQGPLGIVEHVERRARTRIDLQEVRYAAAEEKVEGDEPDESERAAYALSRLDHGCLGGRIQPDRTHRAPVAVGAGLGADAPLAAEADDLERRRGAQ